jgi:hypothetical protein
MVGDADSIGFSVLSDSFLRALVGKFYHDVLPMMAQKQRP